MEGANPHGIRVYTDTELPQVSLSTNDWRDNMDAGLWVVIGLIALCIMVLWIGANEAERRYQRFHPPDDYDGMSEVKQDDEDSGQ